MNTDSLKVLLRRGVVSALLAAGLFIPFFAKAQLIPASRLTGWAPGVTVGVPGGIPTTRPVFTNMTGLDNTGATDVRAALQAAINACPSNQVVAVPAGTFRVGGTIYLDSGRTLRGAGMSNTTFLSTGGFRIEVDNSYYTIDREQLVTGGLTKGSTNIGVADTSSFAVGRLCLIAQFSSVNQYDNPLIASVWGTNTAYGYIYRTTARVTGKSSSGITIWPPLYGDMSARHARIKSSWAEKSRIGMEDMTISLSNSQVGIALGGVHSSWIKNVRIRNANNYSISLYDSHGMEVRDSFLDDLNHSGSNGAGLLFNTVSASLVENNIIMNSFPGMEINFGSCGNVFGYNFLLNTNGLFEIDSNHGPHNAYNLYEGNVAGRFLSDSYFGSESDGTIFRNWLHGQIPGQTAIGWALSLKRFTRNYSVVGNILGSPAPFTMAYDSTSFGQPNMGNGSSSGFAPPWADWLKAGTSPGSFQELDTNVVATLIRKGNYNFFDRTIPAGESLGAEPLPDSLYRTSKPAWFGEMAWPPFDPRNPTILSFTNIPAGLRYVTGSLPVAGTPPRIPTGVVATGSGPQ